MCMWVGKGGMLVGWGGERGRIDFHIIILNTYKTYILCKNNYTLRLVYTCCNMISSKLSFNIS